LKTTRDGGSPASDGLMSRAGSDCSFASAPSVASMASSISCGSPAQPVRRRRMSAPAVCPVAGFNSTGDKSAEPYVPAVGIGYCRECLVALPPTAVSPYCGPGRCLLGPGSPRSPTANGEAVFASPLGSPGPSPPLSPRLQAAGPGHQWSDAAAKRGNNDAPEEGMQSPGSPLVLAPAHEKSGFKPDVAAAVIFRNTQSHAYNRLDPAPEPEKHKRRRRKAKKQAAETELVEEPPAPLQRRGSAPAVFDATASLTEWDYRPPPRDVSGDAKHQFQQPVTMKAANPPFVVMAIPAAGPFVVSPAQPNCLSQSQAAPVQVPVPCPAQPGPVSQQGAGASTHNKMMEGLLKAAMPEVYED